MLVAARIVDGSPVHRADAQWLMAIVRIRPIVTSIHLRGGGILRLSLFASIHFISSDMRSCMACALAGMASSRSRMTKDAGYGRADRLPRSRSISKARY